MPEAEPATIAIIGAGISGLTLALSLHAQGIQSIVYEAGHGPTQLVGGSLNLAPNGLAALERLNILPKLQQFGVFYRYATVNDKNGVPLSKTLLGDKDAFHYEAMRVMRSTLLAELSQTVEAAGIAIHCNKKFSHILSESKDNGVTFEFTDGTTATTSLLIGADGIWSRVRRQLFPDVEAQYVGHIVIATSCNANAAPKLNLDEQVGMYLGGDIGTVMLGQHDADKSRLFIGLQLQYPNLGREGWKALGEDKEKLHAMLTANKDQWPYFIQDVLNNCKKDEAFLWALHILPNLKSWRSPTGRVLLIADAAHAMPPSGGQGANQAFEDGYTLGLTLGEAQRNGKRHDLDKTLTFWENMRRERIADIIDLTMQWNKLREVAQSKGNNSETIGNASKHEESVRQLKPIYGGLPVQEEKIRAWAKGQELDGNFS